MAGINVFVVDAARVSRSITTTMLASDAGFDIVGTSATLSDALQQFSETSPDVVLLDDSIQDADLPKAIWQITSSYRDIGVVAIGRHSDAQTLRRYILAGARGFVPRPLNADDLRQTVRQVYEHIVSERQAREEQKTPATGPLVVRRTGELGHTVALFGSKGGVGKTTVAANLAVAVARLTDKRVGMIDADWALGELGLLFDMSPVTTVLEFVEHVNNAAGDGEVDLELLKALMQRHTPTGIRVLLSASRPEHADFIEKRHVHVLLATMPRLFDFVFVDCPVGYDERTLFILEHTDQLLFVVTPDIGALKNARSFLNVTEALGFERDRIAIVLNRHDSQVNITSKDVQEWLAFPIRYTIASGGVEVARAANQGEPLVMSGPRHRVSRDIIAIARDVIELAAETRRNKHTGMLQLPEQYLD